MLNSITTQTYALDVAINSFLFHCQYEKNLGWKTLAAYKTDLIQFEAFIHSILPDTDIFMIGRDDVKAYLQELAKFKPKTVKRKVAALKAMFAYMEFDDDSFVNPFRRIKVRIKEPFVLPNVLTLCEVEKLLTLLYKERQNNDKTDGYTYKAQTRNIVILELLFATGVRVSELCGLKNNQIDLKSGTIKVYGKGNRERIIQICNKETLAILIEYYRLFRNQIEQSEYFLINRLKAKLTTQSVRYLIKECVKKAGMEKKITPHTFRHTFATLLLEEDVDIKYIQNLLGHSSIATTQIYTHVNTEKQKQILTTKHPRRRLKINQSQLN